MSSAPAAAQEKQKEAVDDCAARYREADQGEVVSSSQPCLPLWFDDGDRHSKRYRPRMGEAQPGHAVETHLNQLFATSISGE
jgi:hypothetical protein